MRKNHHGKKDRLVKRVFALCLALAVICTCLVPVFATEDLSDLQVEKELPGTSERKLPVLAGTKLPIWAMRTMRATCRI